MPPFEKPDDPFNRCPIDWDLRYFAVLSINHNITPDGVIITITTDRLAHLFMSYTNKPPWVHRKAKTTRGLRTLDADYWCFVHYRIYEQIEQGSTLQHTFYFTDWPFCETRWFYYFGQLCTPLEQWHKTLTDNNPWQLHPPDNPPTTQFEKGILTLTSTNLGWRYIYLDLGLTPLPLISEYLKDLHFSAYFPEAKGTNPTNFNIIHFNTYTLDETFLVELVISQGNRYWKFGADINAGPTGGWIGYGKGPSFINLRRLWEDLRRYAGLLPSPEGWYVDEIRISLEQMPPGGTNELSIDWLDVYYYPWAGIIPSHSPIFKTHNPGYSPWRILDEPWSWKGDQPPDFVLLLDEPWGE